MVANEFEPKDKPIKSVKKIGPIERALTEEVDDLASTTRGLQSQRGSYEDAGLTRNSGGFYVDANGYDSDGNYRGF